jgi:hypothetical protein
MAMLTAGVAASESITRRDIYKTLHSTIEKSRDESGHMQARVMRLSGFVSIR